MDFKSSDYSEAFKKFSDWIETNQAKLNSSCHCNPNNKINFNQNHANHLTSTPNTATANSISSSTPPLQPLDLPSAEATTTTTTNTTATINNDQKESSSNNNLNSTTNYHPNHSLTNGNSKNDSQSITSTTNGIITTGKSDVEIINHSLSNHVNGVGAEVLHSTPITSRRSLWKNVISQHEKLQGEIEEIGKQLNDELKRHLNSDKSLKEEDIDECAKLEEKWHKLWLESLEQLVIVERTQRCPKHNTTLIGKPSSKNLSPANKSMSQPQRRRPLSYPSNQTERLEWDYKHTLSLTGCHKENGSHVDLDSVDEQVTKNLTEFGENYEVWLAKDDEIGSIPMHSRPPSVEPAEKPELAKATVITSTNSNSQDEINCNLLMLTSPSSMLTVDATKTCSHNSKQKQGFGRQICFILLSLLVLLFSSALFQEPHHMHKSYYHTQPPV